MGCFDVNCIASGNAISHGSKAVAIFSARQFMKMDQYTPIPVTTTDGLLFFPLKGEYNDYGYLENFSDEFNKKLITELLEKHFAEVVKYEAYDDDESIIESYATACRREKAYLPHNTYAHSPIIANEERDDVKHNNTLVNLFFISREIYDSLVRVGLEREHYISCNADWQNYRYASLKNLNFSKSDISDYVQYLKDNLDMSLFDTPEVSAEKYDLLSRAKRRLLFSGDLRSAKALFHDDFSAPEISPESPDIVLKYHLLDMLIFVHHGFTGERENTFYVLDNIFNSPLVLKFIEYLKNDDMPSACEFIERYIETKLFHEGMNMMHRNLDGSVSKFAYMQHDQIDTVIGRSFVQLAGINSNIEKLKSWVDYDGGFDESLFAPDSSMNQLKKALIETLEKLNAIKPGEV